MHSSFPIASAHIICHKVEVRRNEMSSKESSTKQKIANYLHKFIQVLTSDAATGFTLWEGSVTLNNRCCPDQNRQKHINQIASTQI
jgi:hypothetical protein